MSSVPDCITAAGGGNVKFAAAASVFLKLARRNCLGERQILVCSTMGQEKPRRSIPPASCPLDGDVQCAGFWFAITHHLVVLDDQAHVMITGAPEFMFQHRAIVAGFHIAASGALNNFRTLEQFVEENRVVQPFPVHTGHSGESSGGMRRIKEHSTNGNCHRDMLAPWLVQDGRHRSFQAVPR